VSQTAKLIKEQQQLKLELKHFKNLVKSTVFMVCLKDRKLLKQTESGKLFQSIGMDFWQRFYRQNAEFLGPL